MSKNNIKTSKKPFHMTNKVREWLTGYTYILPWFLGLLIFTLWPLLQAFIYSFNDAYFSGDHIEKLWIFLDNFIYAFSKDATFPTLLVNYLFEIIVQVPFSVAVALVIAMLLNQKIKLRGIWRVIFFLPVIISSGPVILELMNQGATQIPLLTSSSFTTFINEYLPSFIAQPITLLFDKLIVILWYSGIPILIFLSGLQKMDKSAYEAAAMDGASPWQSFWKITLPSMKPFILVSIIYMIVILSFSGLPSSTSQVTILSYMQTQMLKRGSNLEGQVIKAGYGYACTLGIIYFVIILLQIGIYALIFLPKRKKH